MVGTGPSVVIFFGVPPESCDESRNGSGATLSSEKYMHPEPTRSGLPIPFYDDPWKGEERQAAQALWDWHLALFHAPIAHKGDREAYYESQARLVEAGRPPMLLDSGISRAALEACETYSLDRTLLANQVRAAGLLGKSVRFENASTLRAFVDLWAGSHGLLLAGLAGAKGKWQRPWVEHLAFGFFLTSRLVNLPADLSRDRLFLPLEDLGRVGVTVARLRAGTPDDSVRKVIWKQIVRAREAMAQGLPLIDELERRPARSLKRWWHGALEVLNEIERRDFDLWSRPLTLSFRHRFQAAVRAFVGRSIFGRK